MAMEEVSLESGMFAASESMVWSVMVLCETTNFYVLGSHYLYTVRHDRVRHYGGGSCMQWPRLPAAFRGFDRRRGASIARWLPLVRNSMLICAGTLLPL